MGRKTPEDQSTSWQLPSMYAFVGEYGPFKVKGFEPIENTLIWLYNSGETNDAEREDSEKDPRRHPMYPLAGPIQDLLLGAEPSKFTTVLVIDVSDMFESRDEYEEALTEETETLELTKKFGKKLLRLFQKLLLHKVTLAARGELCPFLLKLYKALEAIDADYNLEENNTIAELWLFHPQLSTKYVNTHLVVGEATADSQTKGGGKRKKGKKKGATAASSPSPKKNSTHPVQLNLFHTLSETNKVSVLKPFFPNLGTEVVTDGNIYNLCSIVAHRKDSTSPPEPYSPERCNDLGKMMFVTKMKVEMNKISKQHERNCSEITSELLAIIESPVDQGGDNITDLTAIDWSTCERQIGGLLLRGNRCVLVRSVYGEWEGLQIPAVVPHPHEAPHESAIRAVAHFAEVDASEMEALPCVLPVAMYAPNGKPVLVDLYPLYAVSPPPSYDDGDDADAEDEEDPYDWYTFPRAMARLDKASADSLQCMALNLVQASGVKLVPTKWGGVFGQELQLKGS